MTGSLNLTGDAVRSSLLRHNYFPRTSAVVAELPPSLTTAFLTDDLARQLRFEVGSSRNGKKVPSSGLSWTDAVQYRTSRFDGSTRHCRIPHPVTYAALVDTLVDAWPTIGNIADNPHSAIRPNLLPDGRTVSHGTYESPSEVFDITDGAMPPAEGWRDRDQFMDNRAFGKPYMVVADIKNYFPSFYTHSVPWALHTRSEAKKPPHNLLGDRLDLAVRQTSAGETVGLHIGPGTSTYVAEIVARAVDERLVERGYDTFQRWVDDYVFLADDERQAQGFLRDLELELAKYRLRVNETKTKIIGLPAVLDDVWRGEVDARLAWATDSASSTRGVLDFLRVTALGHAGGSVMRYGLSKVFDFDETSHAPLPPWHVVENARLVATLALADPAIASFAARTLVRADGAWVLGALRALTLDAMRRGRSDAVAWYLDAFKHRGETPPYEVIEALIKSLDTVPLAMAVAAGWITPRDESALAEALVEMNDDYERDEHWLLAHELDLHTGAASSSCGLAPLLDSGASFINFS